MTMQGRVDPRPIKPPAIGLLSSANNVVVGGEPAGPYMRNGVEDVPPDGDPNAADWDTNADGTRVHWINGFGYIPDRCNQGDIIAKDSGAAGTPPNAWVDANDVIGVTPYIVEGIDHRSTFGTNGELEEARQTARRQLLACEGKRIEGELWTGKLTSGASSGNRHLTSNDLALLEGDRLIGYVTALAALEQGINANSCGGQAMIHARADTVTLWASEYLVMRVGNMLVTALGNIVVPGAGYTGSAPDTGTPGIDPAHAGNVPSTDSAWAYATSIVDVRRSAFFNEQPAQERVDRGANDVKTYERRVAAANWGCLHLGIHCDHINRISTTGS